MIKPKFQAGDQIADNFVFGTIISGHYDAEEKQWVYTLRHSGDQIYEDKVQFAIPVTKPIDRREWGGV